MNKEEYEKIRGKSKEVGCWKNTESVLYYNSETNYYWLISRLHTTDESGWEDFFGFEVFILSPRVQYRLGNGLVGNIYKLDSTAHDKLIIAKSGEILVTGKEACKKLKEFKQLRISLVTDWERIRNSELIINTKWKGIS